MYDEKEKFILFAENLEKIYEKEIPTKYKECKSKYLQKINNVNYNNLIFNCFDWGYVEIYFLGIMLGRIFVDIGVFGYTLCPLV